MHKVFKRINIDNWEASLLTKEIKYTSKGADLRVIGMLRLFPELTETHYKSPSGHIICLTLKFSSYSDLIISKFKKLKRGGIFYIKGYIDNNYSFKTSPEFKEETEFEVRFTDLYSLDKNTFSKISNVAVLTTS